MNKSGQGGIADTLTVKLTLNYVYNTQLLITEMRTRY